MTQPRVVPLGPPGAGKGTQSEKVAEHFDVEHVTTGDIFRENKEMDVSDVHDEYDTPGEIMAAGELVPDEVVNAIVEEALSDLEGFVLDGYPRNLAQAEELESMADVDVAFFLEVSEEELVHRLTGRRVDPETGETYHVDYDPPADEAVAERLIQRDDDEEDTVRERLRVYREETEPVVDFYETRGLLERIDGERPPEEVWEDVQAAVEDAA